MILTLAKAIRDFYYNPTTLIIHDDGRIETGKGIAATRWEKKNGRYRFYWTEETENRTAPKPAGMLF